MKNQHPNPNNPNEPRRHRAPYGGSHYGGPYGDPVYYGQAVYGSDDEGGVDLMRLIQIGLRHWKTILLVVAIAAGIGLLYLQLATPIYRASALMEMSVRKPRLLKESAVIEDKVRDESKIFNTRLTKFRSRAMRQRVAQAALESGIIEGADLKPLAEELGKNTSWSVQRDSFVVEVSVNSPDPQLASDIANLYGDAAIQMMVEENRASSDNAVIWLQQQVVQQKAALSRAEQALIDYRTSVSLDALRNRKRVSEETLLQLNQTLTELESKLITDKTRLRYLEKIKTNPGAAETIPAEIDKTGQLEGLISEWWNARLELSGLKEGYTDKHPAVKKTEAGLAQMRKRLDEYLTTLTGMIGNGVNLLQDQVEDIRTRIAMETRSDLDLELKIVKAEGMLNTLEREKEAADTSYRSVLSRIEESRMAADENTAVLKLLQPAEVPSAPVAPRTLHVLALALFLGGLLGYGIAWLLELLEDKLIGISDVERLGLDMLALIPRQPEIDRPLLAKLCLQDKFSHVSETFASLRTILTFDEAKERYRCLLVTSTQPEEGKTIIASNLAIVMAQSGRKTLLIDFDLRRPRLRNIFPEGKAAVSLLHTLDKKQFDSFDKLPVNGSQENLSIITSQPSDKISPAEIIGGSGPAALIAWARENYDCVIIDSPPLGVVGDAQSIADHVDGVILAARPEHTRKRALRHTSERMAAVNTNVIGVVLNNVQIRRHSAYSNDYHHYGSYHAYGSYLPDAEEKDAGNG